jgi:hypothetical protein
VQAKKKYKKKYQKKNEKEKKSRAHGRRHHKVHEDGQLFKLKQIEHKEDSTRDARKTALVHLNAMDLHE